MDLQKQTFQYMYACQLPIQGRLFRIFGLAPRPQAIVPDEICPRHCHMCFFVGLSNT